jgi:hypothetical protein
MNAAAFAFLIHTLCVIHSASVTSWIRTAARNKQVGGVANSLHCVGLAVDVVTDHDADKAPLIKAAKSLGLTAIDETTHIHIEYDHAAA